MILGKKDKTKEKSLIIIGGNKIPIIGEIILVTGNEKKIVAFPKAPSTVTCEKWERPEIAKNEAIPERIPERIPEKVPEKVAKPSSTASTPSAPATNSPKTKSPTINQIFEN
jgi:hypothetical protein